jgi:hypothetical protein
MICIKPRALAWDPARGLKLLSCRMIAAIKAESTLYLAAAALMCSAYLTLSISPAPTLKGWVFPLAFYKIALSQTFFKINAAFGSAKVNKRAG